MRPSNNKKVREWDNDLEFRVFKLFEEELKSGNIHLDQVKFKLQQNSELKDMEFRRVYDFVSLIIIP